MQLFYNPTIVESSKDILFDKEESRHIFKVLRKKEGDILTLTNGKGLFFKVKLLQTSLKHCIANVISFEKKAPLPYYLHLVVAPTKLNDRYEWFLEKATETILKSIFANNKPCDYIKRVSKISERKHQPKTNCPL